MSQPLLIVVTGRPGSGKTTLAHALAKEVHCPAFCRDEFKEGFVNTTNSSHDELGQEVNREIYEAFFQAVEFMLSKGISLVAEAAFPHKLWAPKLEPLSGIFKVAIVICTVDPRVARARLIERGLADSTRERFHGDPAVRAAKEGMQFPVGSYTPPNLSVPTLCVDTSDGYDLSIEEVASFVLQAFADSFAEPAAERGGTPDSAVVPDLRRWSARRDVALEY